MSQAIRQSNIFAGEEWKVIYKAFTDIDFTSYDPPAINSALRAYLQKNYPETFNDWTESSEYVAIIDILSWLAGSLSFRIDLNSRENFLETAESRESVLRLAKFLSYNPRRGQSARGLLKVNQIKTTETVIDSSGSNLNNRAITWNDADNPDWLEQFELVVNAALPLSNKLGVPAKRTTLSSINTELYPFNSVYNSSCVHKFNISVGSKQELFEVVNTDISENGFDEVTPNPNMKFNIVYRMDGKGYGSPRSGFFMHFKQGELKSQNLSISSYDENKIININTPNVSETDVWVQSISDTGLIDSTWNKVPALAGDNITFNTISTDLRDIYTVNTESGDRISIRFGDGRFGNIPFGNLKIWYRTINNLQYTLKPKDVEDISIVIPYLDRFGRSQILTLTMGLQEEISNAIGSESIDEIRFRAPQVYSTQNRMVSGEDYNIYPLTTNEIIKSKAVNRVYSGQSRYLDIIDPTATYQDVLMFCDDGAIHQRTRQHYTQVPLAANLTTDQLINTKVRKMLEQSAVRNHVKKNSLITFTSTLPTWKCEVNSSVAKGLISTNGVSATDMELLKNYIHVGASIYFEYVANGTTVGKWASILQTNITMFSFFSDIHSQYTWLSTSIPDGASIKKILPKYRTQFCNKTTTFYTNTSELEKLRSTISGVANNSRIFFYYVAGEGSQILEDNTNLPGRWNITTGTDTTGLRCLTMEKYGEDCWNIYTPPSTFEYIFTSEKSVRFAKTSNSKKLDGTLQTEVNDTISVISGVGTTIDFDIVDNVKLTDGTIDASSVIITPSVLNNTGGYYNPFAFEDVQAIYAANNRRVVMQFVTTNGVTVLTENKNIQMVASQFTVINPVDQQIIYNTTANRYMYYYANYGVWYFYKSSPGLSIRTITGGVNYKWKHYADLEARINPAITNIIDIFVLTVEYDYNIRKWISEGMVDDMPIAPDSYYLKNQFAALENYKMFSDEIVWRPVTYKFLFGAAAEPELQCKFNVIKLNSASISEGEIKSKIIAAINSYFAANKWDFGEPFYFTELATAIHIALNTYISSIVIVPLNSESNFGNMFQITCQPDEMFLSCAGVDDIQFVDNFTNVNMRIGN
jgi:hypothetical protein